MAGVKYSNLDRIGTDQVFFNLLMDRMSEEIRCASPAIIQKFYPEDMTVDVQLTVKEKIAINGEYQSLKVPILGKLPVVLPSGGDFILTMPIKEGDECLVIFSDTCIDAWWQNGGDENEQIIMRRHNLSDGFAIVGVRSNKRKLSDYNEDSVELRNVDGTVKIEFSDEGVIIKADSIKLGDDSGLRKLIDERIVDLYNQHTHPYVNVSSPATTSPPTTPIVLANVSTEKTEAL
jgi:hypothetical protein